MKNKIFIFTGGMLTGLILGVLFSVAIKELILQFKEVHLSLNKINIEQSELSQRLDSIQVKLIPDTKKTNTPNAASNTKPVAQYTSQQANTKPPTITANSPASNTSTKADSDIVIMTNQLIVATSISVEKRDTVKVNKRTEKMDSTIAAMSDVSESQEPQEYKIEFWKSPLNYRGYKMSRSKIVVYGVQPAGGVIDLFKNEGSYYLLNGSTTYRLEYTDDYKPLEQVTDKATLKKLGL
jgi:hypothetical protein